MYNDGLYILGPKNRNYIKLPNNVFQIGIAEVSVKSNKHHATLALYKQPTS